VDPRSDSRQEAGITVWLTGLPGAGKSTVGDALYDALRAQGRQASWLDGDDLRRGLNADLDFSAAGRAESVRRAGEVARLLALSGTVVVASLVSPYRADRDRVRQRHAEAGIVFFEVWVSAPLAVCEERDTKGLYARARRGELKDVTGVGDPYEPPLSPDLELPTHLLEVPAALRSILDALEGVRREGCNR
jgi:bifunctional enzyme CysN/CysC